MRVSAHVRDTPGVRWVVDCYLLHHLVGRRGYKGRPGDVTNIHEQELFHLYLRGKLSYPGLQEEHAKSAGKVRRRNVGEK